MLARQWFSPQVVSHTVNWKLGLLCFSLCLLIHQLPHYPPNKLVGCVRLDGELVGVRQGHAVPSVQESWPTKEANIFPWPAPDSKWEYGLKKKSCFASTFFCQMDISYQECEIKFAFKPDTRLLELWLTSGGGPKTITGSRGTESKK